MLAPTQRFSARVENYRLYRPGYPAEIIALLARECGLTPASVVADLGSGTGLLADLFLMNGNVVYGVEPNADMRQAGEQLMGGYPNFHSVNGTAEATNLPAGSVDLVTAGQAFHWFDRPRARAEFARILKPGGWVALVWNRFRTDTPLMAAYENLIRTYGTDYDKVNHENVTPEVLSDFYKPGTVAMSPFLHEQVFDFDGFRGRLLSSSYVPLADDPRHAPMLAELEAIFNAHQSGGWVPFGYEAQVYYGQLND